MQRFGKLRPWKLRPQKLRPWKLSLTNKRTHAYFFGPRETCCKEKKLVALRKGLRLKEKLYLQKRNWSRELRVHNVSNWKKHAPRFDSIRLHSRSYRGGSSFVIDCCRIKKLLCVWALHPLHFTTKIDFLYFLRYGKFKMVLLCFF